MGFFTKPDNAVSLHGGSLPALTLDRVEQAIKDMDYDVGREDDYVWAHWDGRYFDFRVFGDGRVLQVRGIWNGTATAADRAGLLATANTWNADKLFPKVFIVPDSDDVPLAVAELNVPVAEGVSDAQLADVINAGLATGEEFFASLDAEFPHAAPAAPAAVTADGEATAGEPR